MTNDPNFVTKVEGREEDVVWLLKNADFGQFRNGLVHADLDSFMVEDYVEISLKGGLKLFKT